MKRWNAMAAAEVRQTVAAFVDERCTDGVFHQKHEACQGIMVWRVDAKEPTV